MHKAESNEQFLFAQDTFSFRISEIPNLSQCRIWEPDMLRKVAASAASTLSDGPYHPVCSIFHLKGSHLITVSGRAGQAQPWCPHPAGEGEEGQAVRGAAERKSRVHGRQALPSSHHLGFPFHIHSYWTLSSHMPASLQRVPPRAVLMFRTQRGREWDLPCPMASSLPKLASDCDVHSRAHAKGEPHSHTRTDAHAQLEWIESVSHTDTQGVWLSADHGLGLWAERPQCPYPKHVEGQPCSNFHLESTPLPVWPPWVPLLSTQRWETSR